MLNFHKRRQHPITGYIISLDQGLIIHIYYNFKVSQEEEIQNFPKNTVSLCFAHLHHFSQYFLLHKKDLVLWNLITYIWFLQVSNFWKADTSWTNFYISRLFILCNTGSCYVHIIGDVNIWLYVFTSPLFPVCPVFVCVCVCVIFNQRSSKNHVTWLNAQQIWCLVT